MEKIAWNCPKWGREVLFPANPDLADVLGRTELDFENLYFWDLLDPKFLAFQVPRSLNSQISRFTDFQTPPVPLPPDELSDPNLTPLPTHPGIKYVARALAVTLVGKFLAHDECMALQADGHPDVAVIALPLQFCS